MRYWNQIRNDAEEDAPEDGIQYLNDHEYPDDESDAVAETDDATEDAVAETDDESDAETPVLDWQRILPLGFDYANRVFYPLEKVDPQEFAVILRRVALNGSWGDLYYAHLAAAVLGDEYGQLFNQTFTPETLQMMERRIGVSTPFVKAIQPATSTGYNYPDSDTL